MEANPILFLSATGDISQPNKPTTLIDLLSQLCLCCRLAVELAGTAETAEMAGVIYDRAMSMAQGWGYRLTITPDGTFTATEMPGEDDSEWRRR